MLALLALAALVGAGLFAWFVRLERAGRSVVPVVFIFGLLVLDATLYPNQSKVATGLFHPGVGADPDPTDKIFEAAFSFRLPDLIIPVALAARLYVRGFAGWIRVSSLWWVAFLGWIAAQGLVGLQNGNSFNLISFEGKALIYLGAFVLASGVPVRDYTSSRAFSRLIWFSAGLASIMIALDELNIRLNSQLPLLPLHRFGALAGDAASLYIALGLIALALGACSRRGRFRYLLAAGPLLMSSAVAEQRAALLALGVSLAMLGLLLVFSRGRVRMTPTEVGLAALLAVAVISLPTVVALARGAPEARIALARQTVDLTFRSRAKQLSAESRVNQWNSVKTLLGERPVLGHGLGKTYTYWDPGHREFVATNLTHNIGGDLIMRGGAIALLLFAFAIGFSLKEGVDAWRKHADDLAAAFALACAVIILGLVAKGMVESLFEKFRVATLLGLLIGMTGSAVASLSESARAEETR